MKTASQLQTVVGQLSDSGSAAFIHQLSANDKTWLLVWLVEHDPDTAAAAVGQLMEWHADPKRRKARASERRQRQNRRERQEAACSS